MEVTADNFEDLLPVVERKLRECDFVALDLEMTGLHVAGQAKPTKYDTAHDRYSIAKESASNFLATQMGLCTFTWSAEAHRYEAVPFNFYLFPKPQGRNSPVFLSEVSSIRFLSDNGFDFNKLFAKGIPYVSRSEEVNLRQPRAQSNIVLSGNDVRFYDDTCAYIEEWLEKTTAKTTELQPCNSYLLRALYQELPGRFPQLHLSSRKGEGYSKVMVISRLSEEERAEAEAKKEKEKEQAILDQIGVRRVFDALVKAQKPLIGHNMLLDVCHIYDAFIGPLPVSAEAFRAEMHACFPVIFDTKYFGSYCDPLGREFRSTGLDELYTATRDKIKYALPTIEFAEGFNDYNSDSSKCHEAAYDAFCTGYVFIKLSHFVLSNGEEEDNVTPASDLLATWANRIYLARSNDAFNMISLDSEARHSHVFYVFGFDPSVTTSDLLSWFSFAEKGQVAWKTDRSAFVSLPRTILSEQEIIQRCSEATQFSVLTYSDYKAGTAGGVGALRSSGRKRTRDEESAPSGAPDLKRSRSDSSDARGSKGASSCTIM